MGSDVVSIKVRDEFLGWTKENKLDDLKLQHTAIGTSIILHNHWDTISWVVS